MDQALVLSEDLSVGCNEIARKRSAGSEALALCLVFPAFEVLVPFRRPILNT